MDCGCMVAYFCHHLSDDYTSTCQIFMLTCQLFMSTCQIIIMSTCKKNINTSSWISYFYIVAMPLTAIDLSEIFHHTHKLLFNMIFIQRVVIYIFLLYNIFTRCFIVVKLILMFIPRLSKPNNLRNDHRVALW